MPRKPTYVSEKNGRFIYQRRVPSHLIDLVGRRVIKQALNTDSHAEAVRKAAVVNGEIEAYFNAVDAQRHGDAEERFEAARRLCRAFGFEYRPGSDLTVQEIHERLSALEQQTPLTSGAPTLEAAEAILGGVQQPKLMLSQLAEAFFDLTPDRRSRKSEDQLRKYRNPRVKAVHDCVELIGDKPLDAVTRDDLLHFREAQWGRVNAEEISTETANKYMSYLFAMMGEVSSLKKIEICSLEKLKFKTKGDGQRKPLPIELIGRCLYGSVFDRMNDEAKDLFFLMAETGARPLELCGLEPRDIVLTHDAVPHIKIRPNAKRDIKNSASVRDLPLVGRAFEAMTRRPHGLERYAANANVTATINKYLRENVEDLEPGLTAYGLRHAYEDRMIAARYDERFRATILGHRYAIRETYGAGYSLAQRRDMMEAIAIKDPRS